MPTGEPPHKTKGSAPLYLPHKVVWKKYSFVLKKEPKITKKDKETNTCQKKKLVMRKNSKDISARYFWKPQNDCFQLVNF